MSSTLRAPAASRRPPSAAPARGDDPIGGSRHTGVVLSRGRTDRRQRPLLGPRATRPGIRGVAYDTAWLAGLPTDHERRSNRFPTTLRWLADNQLPDGSWGSSVRYEHDRIL